MKISSMLRNVYKSNKVLNINNSYSKSFCDKLKFNYEDPLNFNSLLSEEEQMVYIFYKLIYRFQNQPENIAKHH